MPEVSISDGALHRTSNPHPFVRVEPASASSSRVAENASRDTPLRGGVIVGSLSGSDQF
jgi:hypothetical protein